MLKRLYRCGTVCTDGIGVMILNIIVKCRSNCLTGFHFKTQNIYFIDMARFTFHVRRLYISGYRFL